MEDLKMLKQKYFLAVVFVAGFSVLSCLTACGPTKSNVSGPASWLTSNQAGCYYGRQGDQVAMVAYFPASDSSTMDTLMLHSCAEAVNVAGAPESGWSGVSVRGLDSGAVIYTASEDKGKLPQRLRYRSQTPYKQNTQFDVQSTSGGVLAYCQMPIQRSPLPGVTPATSWSIEVQQKTLAECLSTAHDVQIEAGKSGLANNSATAAQTFVTSLQAAMQRSGVSAFIAQSATQRQQQQPSAAPDYSYQTSNYNNQNAYNSGAMPPQMRQVIDPLLRPTQQQQLRR